MPTLSDLDSEITKPLSLVLTLNKLETYSDGSTEGWIWYSLALSEGKREITACSGTIHDVDVRGLIKLFIYSYKKEEVFEPLGPDFDISLAHEDDDTITITSFVDNRQKKDGAYSGTAIGIRFGTSKAELIHFANELEAERHNITQGHKYKL